MPTPQPSYDDAKTETHPVSHSLGEGGTTRPPRCSITEAALLRNRRTAPFDIFTGSSFAQDSARVFLWFGSIPELAEFLLDEPLKAYKYEEEEAATYQAAMKPIVGRLKTEGFSETLRVELNQVAKATYVVDGWGPFDEIVQPRTEFAQDIVGGFLGDEAPRAVQPDEMDDFLD